MKNDTAQHRVLEVFTQALSQATALAPETVAGQLSRPPRPELGDYAFPCFAYAKAHKLAPAEAAAGLAEQLRTAQALAPLVERLEAAGAFLNVRFKPGVLCASVLQLIAGSGARFGEDGVGAGKTIVIDYSGPNIAKPFHVGHLMSTVLGASLVRIFRALGYTVVGVNHLGDWGVQCGYQFLAWQLADPIVRERELAERGLDYLSDLYVDVNFPAREVNLLEAEMANKEVLTDPQERARIEAIKPEADAREAKARALFKQMEDGDQELRQLWERFRRETLAYLQKSYDRLGVKFESDAGEGFYEPLLKPLLAELQAKGVAVESEGALVIPMDEPPLRPGQERRAPFILRKSDEASIYGTRDLAAALYRKQTYNFHKNLYVVDVRQSSHFQMLFKALAKMGHAWHKDCAHVSFGIMQIKEGDSVLPMTTRGGRMIPLNELLDRMVRIVSGIVLEKNSGLAPEKAARVAEAVGVGAIIYWVQARRRTSNFVFDWQQATDPNGDTGPYLQYSHARACSILRKSQAQAESWRGADVALLREAEEAAIAQELEDFPRVVRQAAESCEPSLVASYLLDLASAFGNFLNKHRVLESPPELRQARLALVDAVRLVLAKGLGLLGVVAPDEM